jgi:glycosyltransferase involved in cell wall biosynthesis
VSVIVPAYNAACTIDATLDSIRNQTYLELEIIVVDDGSSDATAVLVERHQRVDPRIRLFRQENAGVAAARQSRIAEARGDLIAPIDADDLWRPTKIERQMEMEMMIARGDAVGLVYTWVATVDVKGDIVSTAYRPRHEGPVLAQMCRGKPLGNRQLPH